MSAEPSITARRTRVTHCLRQNARPLPALSGSSLLRLLADDLAGVWKVNSYGLPVVSEFQGGPLQADIQGCSSEETDRVEPDINRKTR